MSEAAGWEQQLRNFVTHKAAKTVVSKGVQAAGMYAGVPLPNTAEELGEAAARLILLCGGAEDAEEDLLNSYAQ